MIPSRSEVSSATELVLRRTGPEDTDFQGLVIHLDRELLLRDGDDHAFYAPHNRIDKLNLAGVVIAYLEDKPVGCGAFRPYDETTAEIKRMFVFEHFRGRRIAAIVLRELEHWAIEKGFSAAVLETGHKQPEAIALYKRCGYEVIPNYGQYSDALNSVCMKNVF